MNYTQLIQSRKTSKKSLENWTEDKYCSLWYLYDAVVNGITYDHFKMEYDKFYHSIAHRETYERIKDNTLSKEKFIERTLDRQDRKKSEWTTSDFFSVEGLRARIRREDDEDLF